MALQMSSRGLRAVKKRRQKELAKGNEADRPAGRITFRPYQNEAFRNRQNGVEVWLWGRQTGKSFTLAAWAVDRLITRPGRLVTVLSNSRANGMELNHKCAEICQRLEQLFEQEDLSPDTRFETMNLETRITINGQVGRIKVLAASPRTARGFSGDLILDEFAFHENSTAIWEAVEPILAANPDYLCRIASTPNGRHNMFYRLATDERIPGRRVPRSLAWQQGLKIFHPITRAEITPEEARSLASDQRAYDQNYECSFETGSMALLTHELIDAAERPGVGMIYEQTWSNPISSFALWSELGGLCGPVVNPVLPPAPLSPIAHCRLPIREASLFLGVDVGRHRDLTVMTLLEKAGSSFIVRGILRMRDCRLPLQQEQLEWICGQPGLRRAHLDMTGLGLGLYEYAREKLGAKIHGINFASSVRMEGQGGGSNGGGASTRITEHLATQLLQAYEDRRIQHPIDPLLREDLRLPERIVTPSGRVSIAVAGGGPTHADHFWSLALALNAAKEEIHPPGEIEVIEQTGRMFVPRKYLIL